MQASTLPETAETYPEPAPASLHRDWKLFTLLTFLFSFGFAVYGGVFQNFLRDLLHAGPLQLGQLESTREIPGLLFEMKVRFLLPVPHALCADHQYSGNSRYLTARLTNRTDLKP